MSIRGDLMDNYSPNDMSREEAEWRVQNDLEQMARNGNEEAQEELSH